VADLTVLCGDCRDYIPYEDVMITDPPYSERVHRNPISTHTLASGGPAPRDFGFAHLDESLREYIALCASAVRRWSVVFADLQGGTAWDDAMRAASVEPIRWLPWVRWSQPQISGDRPPSGAELVLVYHAMTAKGKPIAKHWNGPGNLTHFEHKALRGVDKHPTEKPLDLMVALVSAFSDPGETVYDPCCGRGTTAKACQLLGRGFIGYEQQERWANAARARLDAQITGPERERVLAWCDAIELHAKEACNNETRAAAMLRDAATCRERIT
jgi:hypothetical protein